LRAFPALIESRGLRLGLFTACYFSQGVPIGLLTIALPAWLAAQGLSVGEIAAYQGVVSLPWGLKLIGGPFMDRFSFPPMGRRRPWILSMQAGLTLAFVGLAVVDDPLAELPLVIALGFVVNAFGALQDVAVDGMAIDVLPVADRGRANAFMAFGQIAGYSGFSAISGYLLARYGLAAAALAAAFAVGVVLLLVVVARERPGERRLPWSEGDAALRPESIETSFRGIFAGLFRVLLLPMSLVLTLSEWLCRMRDGIAVSVFPVVATQTLGYSAEAYASFQGGMGIAVAVAGLAIGPFIDRFGAERLYRFGIAGSALATLVVALGEPYWSSDAFAISLWIAISLFTQVVFVSFIACAMTICWPRVAASQFAIYMSLSNLARSAGAWAFAPFANELSAPTHFLLMSLLMALAFAVMLLFRFEHQRERIARLDAATSGAAHR
jgi:PAT family beta-lactamase induction signal transducer AmpG